MIESRITIPRPAREIQNPETASIATRLRLSPYEPAQLLRFPLADGQGRQDAPQILAYLNAAIEQFGRSPWLREFTVSILPPYTRDNDQAVILGAIVEFVRDRMRYLADPEGGEYLIDPLALIEQIKSIGHAFGDCDDHVALLCGMARSVGFETRAIGVHLHDAVLWDHVIAQVNLMGRWVDIDPCVKTNETPAYQEKLI